jgi:hypothetical protein
MRRTQIKGFEAAGGGLRGRGISGSADSQPAATATPPDREAIEDLPAPVQQFETAYWPERNAGWRTFGAPIMASSATEAMEMRDPQAVGRYRVTPLGTEQPGALFVIRLTREGCVAIPVDAF